MIDTKQSQTKERCEATDEQLITRYQKTGDGKVFALLVKRYERELYSYLQRYMNDAALAEDAFQGTFLHVHLKCQQFDSKRRFRPWLYSIATNHAIDLQRKNKRHYLASLDKPRMNAGKEMGSLIDLLTSSEESAESRLNTKERREWVQTSVEKLPEPLQAALRLVYFGGMKYSDAAKTLSLPVGTVKSRVHVAVTQLRNAWSRSCFAAA